MNTDIQKGRVVFYTLKDGQTRPAIVVRVWAEESGASYPPGVVNMNVQVDGTNDAQGPLDAYGIAATGISADEAKAGVAWRTSVHPSESGNPEPGRWHWPPRVPIDFSKMQAVPA